MAGNVKDRKGYLIMKAGCEIMRNNKEVVGSLSAIPIRQRRRNVLDSTAHHARRLEWQRQAIRRQVASGVDWSEKPVGLLRIQRSHRASE